MNRNLENKNILSFFLRNLAEMIDNDRITNSQMQRVGEFYMYYLFQESQRKGSRKRRIKHCEKDIKKFIFLGWYIYNKILKNETL